MKGSDELRIAYLKARSELLFCRNARFGRPKIEILGDSAVRKRRQRYGENVP